MSDKKPKIVLLGAADRYNYGDNLMPVLFHRFIITSHPQIAEKFDVVCAAVRQTDLSVFGCLPTHAIRDLLSVPTGSLIVVFGGEVLCAGSGALFMHMHESRTSYTLAKILNRIAPSAFFRWANMTYPTPWEFPYIPSPRFFRNEVRTAFNAVGGDVPVGFDAPTSAELLQRIDEASFFSTRDSRFNESVSTRRIEHKIRPDSASSMSLIISVKERNSALTQLQPRLEPGKYVVVQAAPRKLSLPIDLLVAALDKLAVTAGVKVVLLPIGHASGHDDSHALKTIARKLGQHGILMGTLTLIEILSVISFSAAYIGTSLHGAITAQSFGKPHFCLGSKVPKLTAYLRQWSVPPFITPVDHTDVAEVVGEALGDLAGSRAIVVRARHHASMALAGYEEILALTGCGDAMPLADSGA